MNFKVWSILALVTLVFVFTAAAHHDKERVSEMNHPKESEQITKKPAEKHDEKHHVAGDEHARKAEERRQRFSQKAQQLKAHFEKEAKEKMESHAHKMNAEEGEAKKTQLEDKHVHTA